MLWSRARLFGAFAGLLTLVACGFTPVHGPGGGAQGLRGAVALATPPDRLSFVMNGRLEDRLGRGGASAPYELKTSLTTRQQGLGISGTNNITRINVIGKVLYVVTRRDDQVVVKTGELTSFTSYSTTASTVATGTAQTDAEERLMVVLADQIVTDLTATAGDWLP